MKRIVLIGSVVIDEVHTFEGEVYTSFGGITYTLIALAKLLPDHEIVPVTYIGESDYDRFVDFFRGFSNVNFEGVKLAPASNENILVYQSKEERIERFKFRTPPIKITDVYPFLDAEAVYVNYIKNDDFSLADLRSLSSAFREGIIYIDIHSLIRKVDEDGFFVPYYYQGWQALAGYADYLQLNEEEARFFTGFNFRNDEELKNLVLVILLNGPRGVSVTLGSRGVIVGFRESHGAFVEDIEAPRVEVKDPTGCGDVFGAAFLKSVLEGKSPVEAAKFAVEIASKKSTMSLEEFRDFPIN